MNLLEDFDKKLSKVRLMDRVDIPGWVMSEDTVPQVKAYITQKITEALEGMTKPDKKGDCGCAPFQSQHDGYCWSEEFPGESKGYNTRNAEVNDDIDKIIKSLASSTRS